MGRSLVNSQYVTAVGICTLSLLFTYTLHLVNVNCDVQPRVAKEPSTCSVEQVIDGCLPGFSSSATITSPFSYPVYSNGACPNGNLRRIRGKISDECSFLCCSPKVQKKNVMLHQSTGFRMPIFHLGPCCQRRVVPDHGLSSCVNCNTKAFNDRFDSSFKSFSSDRILAVLFIAAFGHSDSSIFQISVLISVAEASEMPEIMLDNAWPVKTQFEGSVSSCKQGSWDVGTFVSNEQDCPMFMRANVKKEKITCKVGPHNQASENSTYPSSSSSRKGKEGVLTIDFSFLPEGTIAPSWQCDQAQADILKMAQCAASQSTEEKFIKTCQLLRETEFLYRECVTPYLTVRVKNTHVTPRCSQHASKNSVKIGDGNCLRQILAPTSSGLKKVVVSSRSGLKGFVTKCFHQSPFIAPDYINNLYTYEIEKALVEVSFKSGQISCSIRKQTAHSSEIMSLLKPEPLECSSKQIPISSISCKSSWKLMQVTFEVDISFHIFVNIPPAIGYCKSLYGKTSSDSNNQQVRCYVYAEKISSFIPNPDYTDFSQFPLDRCGCSSDQLCYQKEGKLISIAFNLTKRDRMLGYKSIKMSEHNFESSHTSKLNLNSFSCLTKYGILNNMPLQHHFSKESLVPEFLVEDPVLIGVNQNQTIEFTQKNKADKIIRGVFSKDVSIVGKNGVFHHKSVEREQLHTLKGKIDFDHCVENHNDGTELGYREVLRCKAKVGGNIILQFWIMICVVSLIFMYTIVHFARVVYSIRKRTLFWPCTCFDKYCMFCPASTNFKNFLETECCLKSFDYFTAVACKETYEKWVICSKTVCFILKAISIVPILMIPLFTLLTAIWIVKIGLTIILMPLRLCKVRFSRWIVMHHWYEVLYGPASVMPCFGKERSSMRVNMPRCKIVGKSMLSSGLSVALVIWIVLSSLAATASADGIGQSYNIIKECNDDNCRASLIVKTELFFSKGFFVTHMLMDDKKIVGKIHLEIVSALFSSVLNYQFTNPKFEAKTVRIICKTDDMQFNQKCWGRFWNAVDEDEVSCAHWGDMAENFIPKGKNEAVKGIYECNTWGPKGFWWGLSSPSDGFEYVGLSAVPNEELSGRRQWSIGDLTLQGEVRVVLILYDATLLDTVIKISRLVDTHSFESDLGTIKLDERRVSGNSISGSSLNCYYTHLKESISPMCHIVRKEWEDLSNLNVFGEPLNEDVGYLEHNGLNLKRTGGLNDMGSNIHFKNGFMENVNYYSGAPRAHEVSGCDISVFPLPSLESDVVEKCTDRSKKTEASCNSAREAWGKAKTSVPAAMINLTNCMSVKLDASLDLNLEFASSSSDVQSLDIFNIFVKSEGCYGGNFMVKIEVTSDDMLPGSTLVSTSSKYVSCPSMFFYHEGHFSFNCTSGLPRFVLTMSNPTDASKKKDFNIVIKHRCASYSHEKFCDSCNRNIPVLDHTHWTVWEIILLVIIVTSIVVVVLIFLSYAVPASFSVGRMTAERRIAQLPISNLQTMKELGFEDYFLQRKKK